jgi:hypothetical protein
MKPIVLEINKNKIIHSITTYLDFVFVAAGEEGLFIY